MGALQVIFPKEAGGLQARMCARYYRVYYGYVLSTLRAVGAAIRMGPDSAIGDGRYVIEAGGTPIVIDYSDHLTLADRHADYPYYFKFHYTRKEHEHLSHLFPFSPISFYDWKQYEQLRQSITYSAHGERILNRQKPHGNAVERRRYVQQLLRAEYGKTVMTKTSGQLAFWEELNDCLVAVCVPGSRNNMLDRGQHQFLGLGGCTISPEISTMLPGFRRLQPDVHYVRCADDYSDLLDKIEWCRANRAACVDIGQQAQQLFSETAPPAKLWEWVQQVINGDY